MTTLLRIANEKYIKNVSHDKGFSLNGGIRNNSYVGQTSLARKTNKPYFTRYNGPAGHGGCCGKYYISFTFTIINCLIITTHIIFSSSN
jgi:hypothetical protein